MSKRDSDKTHLLSDSDNKKPVDYTDEPLTKKSKATTTSEDWEKIPLLASESQDVFIEMMDDSSDDNDGGNGNKKRRDESLRQMIKELSNHRKAAYLATVAWCTSLSMVLVIVLASIVGVHHSYVLLDREITNAQLIAATIKLSVLFVLFLTALLVGLFYMLRQLSIENEGHSVKYRVKKYLVLISGTVISTILISTGLCLLRTAFINVTGAETGFWIILSFLGGLGAFGYLFMIAKLFINLRPSTRIRVLFLKIFLLLAVTALMIVALVWGYYLLKSLGFKHKTFFSIYEGIGFDVGSRHTW
ncbi:hypothetical protein NEHOM01_0053 [Nematocida homosporus]|uniref:uncharacterized protein n=1 Tax=Nematocida homosporus TaxID=1912981 RepID=UPI0022211750|nr:uncharacterized protein NEHOM01_0053 [Nematocida homosporus]KAI5184308.1 hypothetical protein NEHOM01_0053 [Nematocida homosporus]